MAHVKCVISMACTVAVTKGEARLNKSSAPFPDYTHAHCEPDLGSNSFKAVAAVSGVKVNVSRPQSSSK